MKKFIFALTVFCLSFSVFADKAEANHGVRPYGIYSGYYSNYIYRWGWITPGIYVGALGYNYVPYVRPYRPNRFAAIAYSAKTGSTGWSYGNFNRYDAERGAVNGCGDATCESFLWVRNGCAALAKDSTSNRIGWGLARQKYQARSTAIRGCRRGGTATDCKIIAWACSG